MERSVDKYFVRLVRFSIDIHSNEGETVLVSVTMAPDSGRMALWIIAIMVFVLMILVVGIVVLIIYFSFKQDDKDSKKFELFFAF